MEGIVLSKISQTGKGKYCMVSYVESKIKPWGLFFLKKQNNSTSFLKNFLVVSHSIRDLVSLTGDQTCSPCIGVRVLTTRPPGKFSAMSSCSDCFLSVHQSQDPSPKPEMLLSVSLLQVGAESWRSSPWSWEASTSSMSIPVASFGLKNSHSEPKQPVVWSFNFLFSHHFQISTLHCLKLALWFF